MSGFGMGSVLVNYYRKKTDDDDHIPKVRCLPRALNVRVYPTSRG
jgi:hypothetical protein